MNLLIAGDYCDNGRVSTLIRDGAYDSLFNGIKEIVQLYDYRIVNFEFPVVSKQGKPIKKCGPSLQGQPQSIDALKYAGFNVCTLANNHILDQGPDCLNDTIARLNAAEIKTVGAGSNLEEAAKTLFLEKDGESVAIINCCEHEFSIADENAPGANPLNPIKQYYSIIQAKTIADYVIVIVHGGVEHYQYPTKRMIELYRFFIDMGADIVINHHQHCYCGKELYRGKPIFYGLGNFLFDWNNKRDSIWNWGVAVGVKLNKDTLPCFEIYPINQCNHIPGVFLMNTEETEPMKALDLKIGKVIMDDNMLDSEYNKMIQQKEKEYQFLIEPIWGRISNGFYRRGWIPSLIPLTKLAKLYNYISCESHNEVFKIIIKRLIDNK